ncbi:MAG: methionyl-tRNA formyltransferase [candidate division WS1 bacterium]|nr:methionyl-tRNA formyltransferase [candidate division WS1 bacterium]
MKIAFFGTPDTAVPYLRRLAQEHEVVAVVTQPDRPRGRGRRLAVPPVKAEALRLNLPVLQPGQVKCAEFCRCTELRAAEASVVVAYGQILPAELCATADRPALNVHYSLLPDLRGAAPVQRALLEGRQKTGITVQYVAEELDAGDIILQREVAIAPEDDAERLFEKLQEIGVPALSRALRLLEKGQAPRVPQDGRQATYALPLRPEEAAVHWGEAAETIVNQVRAFSPSPGAYCHHQGRRLKLSAPELVPGEQRKGNPGEITNLSSQGLTVQTGEGSALIGEVQPEGRRRMGAADYARGARLSVGDVLQNG